MGLIVSGKGGGTDFEPIPEGTYVARCVSVVDLGIQQTNFGAKEKIYVGWEVPSVRVKWEKDDKEHEGPALIGSQYTASIHEKSILGQHLTSWRGKQFTEEERNAFDVFNVLGAPCMISVTHNKNGEKTYANVNAVMRLPQGTECPDAETDLVAYTPQDNQYAGNLDKLPEWLQNKCREGHKLDQPAQASAQSAPPTPEGDYFDDDIPFDSALLI